MSKKIKDKEEKLTKMTIGYINNTGISAGHLSNSSSI